MILKSLFEISTILTVKKSKWQRLPLNFFVILSVLIISASGLQSQTDSLIFDTKGVDFRLAFLPNYHNNYSSQYANLLQRTDSLYIFIVADKPTSGLIEYIDRYGNLFNQPFTITNINDIYLFKVSHYDFEVQGYNRSGTMLTSNDTRNQSEIAGINSFHITTDNEVTVYAHSQSVMTSDAFLVLPTDVLGREYLVMTYNSDGSGGYGGFPSSYQLYGSSTPSQFLIVATEDNTLVDIYPKTDVYRRGKTSHFQISLNTGEVYLVQAKITQNNLKSDLTGTLVESSNPIAVFGGQQRTIVPMAIENMQSRDFLCEQLLPVNTWGKNAYVIPYATPFDATLVGYDLFRVLVGNDGTDIFINGKNEGRYNKGEFIERPINGSATIEATGPILVAQFKKTSKTSSEGGEALSDPFMMIVPPKEQFKPDYSVINTQAYEERIESEWPTVTTKAYKVYDQHYISIVAPASAIDKTYLDGSLINLNIFQPIQPNRDYYYANIQVSEGAHRVNSSGRIGVYVYGYGEANSYGYVGGMSMSLFDFKKPKILSTDTCYTINGTIYDNRPGDSRISTAICPESKKINTNVKIDSFTPFADSVNFEAMLIDNFLDGQFEITAKDSIGLDTTAVFDIPGFTVSMDTMINSKQLYIYSDKFRTNTTHCEVFNLRNYGGFNHILSNVYLKKNSALSINPMAPFDINPGETFDLELCFNFSQDTVITDTLYISDGCSDRAIMLIKIEFKGDDTKPKLYIEGDSCRNKFDFVVTDSMWFDSGIEKIARYTSNCKFTYLNQTSNICVFNIEVYNPYKDANFTLWITDISGNETIYSDTIQGFTLTMPQFDSTESKIDFGLEKIGSLYCDTLQFYNTGTLPFVVDNLLLKKNIYFSIPQYQFPLIIYPDEQLTVAVCFNPVNTYNRFEDTLVLMYNCLSKEVALTGKGDSLIYYGDADCDVVIKASAHTIEKKYEVEQISPNPFFNTVKFIINSSGKESIKLSIFDILGNVRASILKNDISIGKNEILLDLEFLPQGVYLYTIGTPEGIIKGTLIKQ